MHAKRGKLFSIVIVLSLATLSTTTGRARTARVVGVTQETTAQQAINPAMVVPLADGTKNPASISDAVALRVVFLSITDPGDTPRLRARFGRMKLREGDLSILLQKLGGLHGLVTTQRSRVKAARDDWKSGSQSASFQNVATLDRELDVFAANAYSDLLGSLSPEGAAKLQEHVAYVKTKIKILPSPKMAVSHH